MPRIATVIEARREVAEANLGDLGTCLILIEMSRERQRRAIEMYNLHGLLGPSDDHLAEVERRIRKVQTRKAQAHP